MNNVTFPALLVYLDYALFSDVPLCANFGSCQTQVNALSIQSEVKLVQFDYAR